MTIPFHFNFNLIHNFLSMLLLVNSKNIQLKMWKILFIMQWWEASELFQKLTHQDMLDVGTWHLKIQILSAGSKTKDIEAL